MSKFLSDEPSDTCEFNESHQNLANTIFETVNETDIKRKVIALFGGWGSGKTTVLRLIEKEIKKQENKNWSYVEFNAWSNSGEQLRRNFLYTLYETLGVEEKENSNEVSLKDRIQHRVSTTKVKRDTLNKWLKGLIYFILSIAFFWILTQLVLKFMPGYEKSKEILLSKKIEKEELFFKPDSKKDKDYFLAFYKLNLNKTEYELNKSDKEITISDKVKLSRIIKDYQVGSYFSFLGISIIFWIPIGLVLLSLLLISIFNKRKYLSSFEKFMQTVFPFVGMGSVNVDERSTTIENGDLSLIDFKELYKNVIEDYAGKNKKKKIFIALDNLDRVEDKTAVEMLHYLEVFVEEGKEKNFPVWFIVPVDEEKLKKIIEKSQITSGIRLENFIEKMFSIRFYVPSVFNTTWRDYFKKQFSKAFCQAENQKEYYKVTEIFYSGYEKLHELSPRTIIRFINELVSLEKIMHKIVPVSILSLAFYALCRLYYWTDLNKLIEIDFFETAKKEIKFRNLKDSFKKLSFYKTEKDLRNELNSIHYQTNNPFESLFSKKMNSALLIGNENLLKEAENKAKLMGDNSLTFYSTLKSLIEQFFISGSNYLDGHRLGHIFYCLKKLNSLHFLQIEKVKKYMEHEDFSLLCSSFTKKSAEGFIEWLQYEKIEKEKKEYEKYIENGLRRFSLHHNLEDPKYVHEEFFDAYCLLLEKTKVNIALALEKESNLDEKNHFIKTLIGTRIFKSEVKEKILKLYLEFILDLRDIYLKQIVERKFKNFSKNDLWVFINFSTFFKPQDNKGKNYSPLVKFSIFFDNYGTAKKAPMFDVLNYQSWTSPIFLDRELSNIL